MTRWQPPRDRDGRLIVVVRPAPVSAETERAAALRALLALAKETRK